MNSADELEKIEMQAQNDTSSYIKGVEKEKKGSMLPKPPKKGELMYCQICSKAMYPEGFSKDEYTRKKEFKWHIHEKCRKEMMELIDRQTPGLLAERNRK